MQSLSTYYLDFGVITNVMVLAIQNVLPKLLSRKLGARKDIPLAYAMVY